MRQMRGRNAADAVQYHFSLVASMMQLHKPSSCLCSDMAALDQQRAKGSQVAGCFGRLSEGASVAKQQGLNGMENVC